MTRDEILAAIEQASELDRMDTGPDEIRTGMLSVVALADTYVELDNADRQYLAEALRDALNRFADALLPYA